MPITYENVLIPRKLVHTNNRQYPQVSSTNIMNNALNRVFRNYDVSKASVIKITTTYNDYKKLHDDFVLQIKQQGFNVTCISNQCSLENLVSYRTLRKTCRKNKHIKKSFALTILEGGKLLLEFLSLINLINTFINPNTTMNSLGTLAICILGILTLFLGIRVLICKENEQVLKKLDSFDERNLINFFQNISPQSCLLHNEGIYFIENISKLDKLSRCFILSYFSNLDYIKQLWFVFEYLFENTEKVKSISNNAHFESYDLMPLTYDEKRDFYINNHLQNTIREEYLHFAGVDFLFEEHSENIYTEYKIHSLDYIESKLSALTLSTEYGHLLMRYLYCIIYMSVKYQYSFSISQMEQLICDTKPTCLNAINQKVCKYIGDIGNISSEEVTKFLTKIKDILSGYCATQEEITSGSKIKKIKFTYDILECFTQKREKEYLDEQEVRLWILIKLISKPGIFLQDRYFFDCCNLLMTNDAIEDTDFLEISSNILHMLNTYDCWSYHGLILKKIHTIQKKNINIFNHVKKETYEQSLVHNLLYTSDNASLDMAVTYFSSSENKHQILMNFWNGNLFKTDSAIKDCLPYFYLLYSCVEQLLYSNFRLKVPFVDSKNINIRYNKYLYNIVKSFFTIVLNYNNKHSIENCLQDITKEITLAKRRHQPGMFETIINEIQQWIYSEINHLEDKEYRNTFVGVLIESTNSHILYFIYNLLNMRFTHSYLPQFQNDLLNTIGDGIYHLQIRANTMGIRLYIDKIIDSEIPLPIKINILLCLLSRGIIQKQNACQFLCSNAATLLDIVKYDISTLKTESELQKIVCELYIYTENINNYEFKLEVFNLLMEHIKVCNQIDNILYTQRLNALINKKCPQEPFPDIIKKINKIGNPKFAAILFECYCAKKKELLEYVPLLNQNILHLSSVNTGINLMQDYLLRHNYYDCNSNIRTCYLEQIASKNYPSHSNVLGFLDIIDSYSDDDSYIKLRVLSTYNHMISLDLFYRSLKLLNNQDNEAYYKQKTLEFAHSLIQKIKNNYAPIHFNNLEYKQYLNDEFSVRNEHFEKKIIDSFMFLEPTLCINNKTYLSGEYAASIKYMYEFQNIYNTLIEQTKPDYASVIKIDHLLKLIHFLMSNSKYWKSGFDRGIINTACEILHDLSQTTPHFM